MSETTAVKVLKSMAHRFQGNETRSALRQLLLMPPIVKFEHADSCLGGNGGIFQSICAFIIFLTPSHRPTVIKLTCADFMRYNR